MTRYIQMLVRVKDADMKKIKEGIQAQTEDTIVLLPYGCELVQPNVLYECDRRACKRCSEECHLTGDIEHAVNFERHECGWIVEKRREGNGAF